MRFQCLIVGRRTVYLNGVVRELDAEGCVEVSDPADVAELSGLPSEWTSQPTPRRRSAVVEEPVKPAPVRGAKEFLDAYLADPDLRAQVDRFRGSAGKMSFLAGLGYRLTAEELEQEVARRGSIVPAAKAPPVPEPPPAPPAPAAPEKKPAPPPAAAGKKRKGK